MGYGEEKGKLRRQGMKAAADMFLTFCGFCGVYLLAAHMLYQEIRLASMLPYLIAGAVAAFLLPPVAEMTEPKFFRKNGRRWLAILTFAVCLFFFAWNFDEILRGCLVLADNIIFYFNYVFGTSCQISVHLPFGKFVTMLGSGRALYQLSDVNVSAITLRPELGANCRALFGTIAFYSALLKTEYGYKKGLVLADILFGGALLAVAFLVGAYEVSWTSLCLLLYLVGLMLTFTMGGAESAGRPERRKTDHGRTGSGSGRRNRREDRECSRGGKTHALTVYNTKSESFLAALVFLVAIVLSVSIFLVRKSSYFDSYDTPWIVEKWEQAGDFVKGLTGGSDGIPVASEEGSTGADETGEGEETADGETGTDISWEPATDEGEEEGTAVRENLPSDDTVLGTLTLEDEMRVGSDTTYLKVLIDPAYYSSADTLYLKCYAGEVYEGDSWSAVTAEDIGVTDTNFRYMNAALAVSTYDLFSQYIRGTASDELRSALPGLFDIGAAGKILVRYMGDSQALFVPYYAISSVDASTGDVGLRSGDGSYFYVYDSDELLPGAAGAEAGEVIDYNAIAASFGDEFLYGEGLTSEYDSVFAEYENEYLLNEIYYDVPESLTRLREEFSEIEIDGKTYDLSDYYPSWWNGLVKEAGLGDCIGYVIRYLTANMTYSRSVAAVPEGADYIETFLFDRKTGYCSHYASAAVMMFRLMGIPARYAEGFAVDLDDAVLTTGGQYLVNVTGRSAHAWVEIYVTGVGWVPVNVTYGNDTTLEGGTSEAETTGDRETSVPETTTTPRTTEEESTPAAGDADGKTGIAVFAKLSELFRSIGGILGKIFRILKTPLVLLLLFEGLRIAVRLARAACLRWKCRGKSEDEKLLICAEDLTRYIDRHLHMEKRHRMTQREIAQTEGDLFARADGKAGDPGSAAGGRKTGWHLFRYHVHGQNTAKPGRGRRRSLADVIVRMGARGGHSLTSTEYEELLGLIRYAGKKTTEEERANLHLTMRKVKLVIYKESPWRRRVFF